MADIKTSIRRVLQGFDVDVLRHSNVEVLRDKARSAQDVAFMREMPDAQLRAVLDFLPDLRQDLFVLCETGFKHGGTFVEFGATNGKTLSNTWLLEKKFGWTGILAEPAKVWHKALAAERPAAAIELDCVWTRTGDVLDFSEVGEEAELSTVSAFRDNDYHATRRKGSNTYKVRTVSFNDMLERHNAPARMDYLSIDTEGSEFDILCALDFDRYRFSIITCEHNFGVNRQKIHDLLEGKGYRRKCEAISQFDDWYVLD